MLILGRGLLRGLLVTMHFGLLLLEVQPLLPGDALLSEVGHALAWYVAAATLRWGAIRVQRALGVHLAVAQLAPLNTC